MTSFSFVIPFFNEADYVKITVPAALEFLESMTLDYELILVDDGSTDGSSALACAQAGKNSRIKVISHATNSGLGSALRTGFGAATKDVVIYSDMDMPFELHSLKAILNSNKNFDMIRGIRRNSRESWIRALYGNGYQYLIYFLFGINLVDGNFALKIFRRDLLQKIPLFSRGSFIDAEVVLKYHFSGLNIISVPVEYMPRKYGQSHLANWKNILLTFIEMWRLRPSVLRHRKANNGAV
jgi:glycosyltransferase involved in cell wall biosynthesis